jgi:hypothetical protein
MPTEEGKDPKGGEVKVKIADSINSCLFSV